MSEKKLVVEIRRIHDLIESTEHTQENQPLMKIASAYLTELYEELGTRGRCHLPDRLGHYVKKTKAA